MHTRLLVALLAVGLASTQLLAWGPDGHMTVGSIADKLIAGTSAAKQVQKILKTSLRTASVWADCAKGVNTTTFKYEGAGQFPECAVYENAASEKLMEAFVRRNVGNCTSPHNTEACHKQYHYTDVAIQQNVYAKGKVGTSDQDIVSALSAAIAVLQGQSSPSPFKFTSKKEALRLLVHYVGDIHQPLHVAAVYLSKSGQVVDPDQGTFDPATETHGGNDLLVGNKKLHTQWDTVTGALISPPPSAAVLQQARAIPLTPGPIAGWSTAWATETLKLGQQAFQGITYKKEDSSHHHQITLPSGYDAARADVQRAQVIKAGARLAQILTTIWPD